MFEKPNYEELEQKVKELEKEAHELRQVERDLSVFKTAVESSINAIGLTDLEGKLIYVNDSCVKMWGYTSKDQILGRFLPEFWEGEGIFRTVKELHEKGMAEGEDIGKRKDGSLFNVEFIASMVKDEDGNPLFMFGSFFDITKRKKAEEALRESEEKYRLLAENVTDVIWTMDMNMNYTYFSPSVERLQGFTPEEAKAQTVEESLTPDSYARAVEIFNDELEKYQRGEREPDSFVNMEVELIRKDGSTVMAEVQANFIYDSNSRPIGAIGVRRDITKRIEMEEALRKAHDELEQRVKERTAELQKSNELMNQEIHERKRFEKELEYRTKSLEEINTALNVLLKKREDDKQMMREEVLFNVKQLVEPYLDKLKKSSLDERQKIFIDTIESNIIAITSPFIRTLDSKYLNLTPSEIHIANLVKQGRRTKEISSLLSLSSRTIKFHRENIRKKLGITGTKSNLRTYLQSLK